MTPAHFVRPRAITSPRDGFIYVADTSARVQKFTPNGKFVLQWRIPKNFANSSEGPEGICALKDGSIAVTNTHAQKVLIYSPQGKLLRQWGTYGEKPGQFLLVTGIVADPDGNLFTADYGGAFDRIQKWTPQGKLLAAWPGHGGGPRQFKRPCGLAIAKNGDLLVADIGNHRVQRLDRYTGKFKGQFGIPGRAPGQLTYPYGVTVDPQGDIFTVEWSHRVQKWTPDGKFVRSWGEPGSKPGQLANPWGLTVDAKSNVYVADTQNHRVQKFRFEN